MTIHFPLWTMIGLITVTVATAPDSHAQSATVQNAAPQSTPARRPNPAMQRIVDDPQLPRVLLIGDSISIGYTVAVRELLAGQANVHRPMTNCGPTTKGLKEIDQWLGTEPWDVIHFNWGLHDLKYMGPNGQNLADPQDPTSRQQVPPDQYEKNLRQLVQRLQATNATLIWRTTTPVPAGAQGRVVGDSKKYNDIARNIMKQHEIAIDDMYAYSLDQLEQIQRPANVHFTPEGSRKLARHVVRAIKSALKK